MKKFILSALIIISGIIIASSALAAGIGTGVVISACRTNATTTYLASLKTTVNTTY